MPNALESRFKANLKRKLNRLYPGCLLLDGNPNDLQGIPDLIILYQGMWAALECKQAHGSRVQPNQEYYVNLMDAMSFAAFIYPENEESVLDDLQRAWGSRRPARVSQRQQVSLDQLRR